MDVTMVGLWSIAVPTHAEDVPVVPDPDKLMVLGELGALLITVKLADAAPVAVGVKET